MTHLEQLEIFQSQNNWKAGIEYIESIEQPWTDEILDEYGWFCSRDKQYEKSIDTYKKLIEKNPDSAKYLYMLGYQYYDKLDFDKAREFFEQSLEKNPNYFKVKYRLAYCYSKLQQNKKMSDKWFAKSVYVLEDAHKQYQKFNEKSKLDNQADYSDICFLHGKQICEFTNYHQRAIELFTTSVELDNDDINKHYQLAKAFCRVDDYRRAKDALVYANKSYIQNLYCEILFHLNEYDKVIQLSKTDRNQKPSAEWYCSLVYSLIKTDDMKSAFNVARKAISVFDKSYNCHNALGYCYERLDMNEDAYIEYLKSLELTKNYVVNKNKAQARIDTILRKTNGNPVNSQTIELVEKKKNGIVARYNTERGFGFIVDDETGESFFFHISDVEGEFLPKQGDKVSFDLTDGKIGEKACDVSLIK